jgi:hypothetical protein
MPSLCLSAQLCGMLCEYSAYRQNQFVMELQPCCNHKPRLIVVAIQLQGFSLQTNRDKWEPDTQHNISCTRWRTFWPPFLSTTDRFRIIGFLDFVHRLKFLITRKHTVSETGSVSVFSSDQWLRLAPSKGPNIICLPNLKMETGPVSESFCFLFI